MRTSIQGNHALLDALDMVHVGVCVLIIVLDILEYKYRVSVH